MKRKEGSITLIVMLVGVVVFLVVAGLVGWRSDRFFEEIDIELQNITQNVKDEVVLEEIKNFCKYRCRICCSEPKTSSQDCLNEMKVSKITIGEKVIRCNQVIKCTC